MVLRSGRTIQPTARRPGKENDSGCDSSEICSNGSGGGPGRANEEKACKVGLGVTASNEGSEWPGSVVDPNGEEAISSCGSSPDEEPEVCSGITSSSGCVDDFYAVSDMAKADLLWVEMEEFWIDLGMSYCPISEIYEYIWQIQEPAVEKKIPLFPAQLLPCSKDTLVWRGALLGEHQVDSMSASLLDTEGRGTPVLSLCQNLGATEGFWEQLKLTTLETLL